MNRNLNKITILGPCALEDFDQLNSVAKMTQTLGFTYLRAQVFKPRTSPDSFQGLGALGLSIIEKVKEECPSLKFVCEVCSAEHFDIVKNTASIIQIGARNMQNFELLKYVAKNFDQSNQDYILLKRGFANTHKEWIEAANYLLSGGVAKERIVLCERGSRSITSPTGVSLDFINALLAKEEGYKVIIDPSHGTKDARFVLPLAKAAMAMDFDGVMIEVHPRPLESVSDKDQAISIEECESFFKSL